ncbi:YbaK/EbsC family protein [Ruania alba]|uniref:Cys-tRNA(Pro) deacylase, prolyl-tRNA editing enzyme YbaK/EbsC n=1 Tax=Ruania alba TaxID=648782 RepID=A0A1H5EQT0_9MICO|nr:YbaK/EbsC family protein [Ruania alba]SED93492.1 Cys-tRNA(Pro) deacylase, prolyl-tRNA editing enzyme YbaK/EbsC [Ruania alba]
MRYGTLDWVPALDRPDLLAAPVTEALASWAQAAPDAVRQVLVAEIDPDQADTADMTATYDLPLEASANCVLVAGKRTGEERIAAAVVRATTRADVNSAVKKLLDVRKASFLPMDRAVADSQMEYGGITPIGLPAGYRVLLDTRTSAGPAIIGSGIRGSKILLPGEVLAELPGAEIVAGLATEIAA